MFHRAISALDAESMDISALDAESVNIVGASSGSRGEIKVVQLTAHAHVVEEWLRLPESRRRHATDAVAFAYRLLRDEPELLDGGDDLETCHEVVVNWLLPYLNKREAG